MAAAEFPRLQIWPRVEQYGRGDFDDVFDTPAILRMARDAGGLPEDHVFYLVDFASQRRPGVDVAELTRLDDEAHAEAAESDGFLLYFRGDVDGDGWCRSFCAWRSREDGMRAAQKPRHRAASAVTRDFYGSYVVTMRDVRLEDGPPGFSVGLSHVFRSETG